MTLKRVERALADLKSSGLVTLSQPRKRLPDGAWKAPGRRQSYLPPPIRDLRPGPQAEKRTRQGQ